MLTCTKWQKLEGLKASERQWKWPVGSTTGLLWSVRLPLISKVWTFKVAAAETGLEEALSDTSQEMDFDQPERSSSAWRDL